MNIRAAVESDFAAMWPIFQAVVGSESTYVFSRETTREDAFSYWFGRGISSYVAEDDGRIVGMYKLVSHQRDLGSHVANASFMVDPTVSGKGTGRAMGWHCLREARRAGYRAMQFNFVVSTNHAAVALWKQLGFAVVGTQPDAFAHPGLGYVDAYVMYRRLDDIEV